MRKLLLLVPSSIFIVFFLYYLLNNQNIQVINNEAKTPEVAGEKTVSQTTLWSKYEVISRDVNYFENMTGYYTYPKEEGNFPVVVMVHEWWGLNDNIKNTAQQLAGQGYRVLAVDLFGSIAKTPEQAREQTLFLDQEKALSNIKAAVKLLKRDGSVPIESVEQFRTTLNELNINSDIYVYNDVGYAFVNPSNDSFPPEEWEKTLDFLETNLK